MYIYVYIYVYTCMYNSIGLDLNKFQMVDWFIDEYLNWMATVQLAAVLVAMAAMAAMAAPAATKRLKCFILFVYGILHNCISTKAAGKGQSVFVTMLYNVITHLLHLYMASLWKCRVWLNVCDCEKAVAFYEIKYEYIYIYIFIYIYVYGCTLMTGPLTFALFPKTPFANTLFGIR